MRGKGIRYKANKSGCKEEQRELLPRSKVTIRCSSLHYIFNESTENLEKAYDLLFEEVINAIRKEKADAKIKTNSNIC